MSESKRTATDRPWHLEDEGDGHYRIVAKQGYIKVSPARAHGKSDAALIVRAVNAHDMLTLVLGEIARGRCDNGRPLAAETARQMAREALAQNDLPWPARAEGRS